MGMIKVCGLYMVKNWDNMVTLLPHWHVGIWTLHHYIKLKNIPYSLGVMTSKNCAYPSQISLKNSFCTKLFDAYMFNCSKCKIN